MDELDTERTILQLYGLIGKCILYVGIYKKKNLKEEKRLKHIGVMFYYNNSFSYNEYSVKSINSKRGLCGMAKHCGW